MEPFIYATVFVVYDHSARYKYLITIKINVQNVQVKITIDNYKLLVEV